MPIAFQGLRNDVIHVHTQEICLFDSRYLSEFKLQIVEMTKEYRKQVEVGRERKKLSILTECGKWKEISSAFFKLIWLWLLSAVDRSAIQKSQSHLKNKKTLAF